jgi:hypothetical protein
LAANKTLTTSDLVVQKLDPGGASRDVTLPAEADSTDLLFCIYNAADGTGENLVIKDDTPATIITLGPGMSGMFSCDGTSWKCLDDTGFYYDVVSGNVGIGTTSPGYKLEVAGSTKVTDFLRIEGGSIPYLQIYDTTAALGMSFQSQNGNFAINVGGCERMRVTSSGNVGIGTKSPDRLLHAEKASALTSTVQQVARLTHITSGTPVAGIGVGLEFEQETAADNNEVIATIEAITTDVTAGSEDGAIVFKTMKGGAAATETVTFQGATITGTFSGFLAAEAKMLNLTGLAGNKYNIKRVKLNISNDPTADENILFRLSFYSNDTMTEDTLLWDDYFNLSYTELGVATAATDTEIKVDNLSGLVKYDKVKFLGANGDIERITALPGTGYSTAVTASAALDDLTLSGDYTDEVARNYKVEIDATGAPDTFKWSNDGGATWKATGVAITGGAQALENGLSVTFTNTTGHTLGDNWIWTSMPVITSTAVSGINAVDTGVVRIAEIRGLFPLNDADSTNEIHAKLEALSAPTASMDIAISVEVQ